MVQYLLFWCSWQLYGIYRQKKGGGLCFPLSTQWFVFPPHPSTGRAGLAKLNHFQALPSPIIQFLSRKLLMTSTVSSGIRPCQICRPSASPVLSVAQSSECHSSPSQVSALVVTTDRMHRELYIQPFQTVISFFSDVPNCLAPGEWRIDSESKCTPSSAQCFLSPVPKGVWPLLEVPYHPFPLRCSWVSPSSKTWSRE